MSEAAAYSGDRRDVAHAIQRVEPLIGPKKLALMLFIGSETILFSTVITQYVVGLMHNFGPTPHQMLSPVGMLGFSVALWASSGTMQLAPWRLHRGDERGMRLWMVATVVLGATFLWGEATEWFNIFRLNVSGSTNIWATTFFSLTGIHGLHVIVGLCLILGQLAFSFRWPISHSNDSSLEVITLYWHFVDGMWIIIYSTVYFWSAFLGG